MKNVLIILFFVIGFAQVSFGQEIGVRFGDTVGGDGAIDGVFAFKKSRIHADVSFGNGGLEEGAVGGTGGQVYIVQPATGFGSGGSGIAINSLTNTTARTG